MLTFCIANGCGPTGRTLSELVNKSPRAEGDAIVCWGVGYAGPLPALNTGASDHNKFQQLERFITVGLRVPEVFRLLPTAPTCYPLLGRQYRHHGGRDIGLLLQPSDAKLYRSDFYVRYVPRHTEFRTWVYRRRILGTYEKVLEHPERYRQIGANFRNGFAFHLVAAGAVPEGLRDLASRAVEALGLDFGAVDTLLGVDGRLYLLEVNTAPGVEGPDRQVIRLLANKIRRWAELGFPKRKGAPS